MFVFVVCGMWAIYNFFLMRGAEMVKLHQSYAEPNNGDFWRRILGSLLLTSAMFNFAVAKDVGADEANALEACLYKNILFVFSLDPDDVKRLIKRSCASEIRAYSAAVDTKYKREQAEWESSCNGGPCVSLVEERPKPDLRYGNVWVDNAINVYRDSLRTARAVLR